jgi:hypothetical protein
VAPDGQRFLTIRQLTAEAASLEVIIVENWTEELKRVVPVN